MNLLKKLLNKIKVSVRNWKKKRLLKKSIKNAENDKYIYD